MEYDNLTVKKELRSECSTTDTDSQGKKFGGPRLSKLELLKQIYGFSYGKFSPTEPLGSSYWPGSPEDWYLFNHTGLNTFYQYDPGNGWINLGPTVSGGGGPVPTGTNRIILKNNFAGTFLNLFEVISRDDYNNPLLMTDNGLIVKKDIEAGGSVGSLQGALVLGSGWTSQFDPPIIMLFNSDVQGILGGGYMSLGAVPSGWPFPTAGLKNGQLWIRTDAYDGNPAYTLYKYNSATTHWDVMGPKADFEYYFDTLYLVNQNGYKPDDSTLANMKLKNLAATGTITVGSNKSISQDGDALKIMVNPSSCYLKLWQNGYEVVIQANGLFSLKGNTIPYTTNYYDLGSLSKYWKRVYAGTFYGKTGSIQTGWDSVDDLGLVKNYKLKRVERADGQEIDAIDFKESLPFLLADETDEFVDVSKVSGFALGCIKHLVLRVEALEKAVNNKHD